MKIIIVNAVYMNKSTGRTYFELYKYLSSLGHECKIIYGEKKENYKEGIYLGNYFDHKLHAFYSRITGKGGCYSKNSTRKLLKFLDIFKPDIVHLGNLHANFINIPMLLEYLGEKNIPTTVTLHDCFFYTGGCVHYTVNKCFKWKKKCDKCDNFREQGSWLFDNTKYLFEVKNKYFKNIKKLGVIGVSKWITEEARQSCILKRAKITKNIYDWVDLDVFKPLSVKKEELCVDFSGKFIILGVASKWNPNKGLNKFIELSKILSFEFIIILVGNIKRVDKLPANIINIPEITSVNKLAEYYNIADVFLQLSIEETFGKVVAEALACGTPAIVYNSTASPELIDEGCGYSINIEDSVNIILQKIKLIKMQSKYFYSNNCRQKAINEFDKNKNCGQILKFWNDLKRE